MTLNPIDFHYMEVNMRVKRWYFWVNRPFKILCSFSVCDQVWFWSSSDNIHYNIFKSQSTIVTVLARLWPDPEVFSTINVQQALIWPDAGFYGCYNVPLNWTLDSVEHTGQNQACMKISVLSLSSVWSGCQTFPAETGQLQSRETLCDLQNKKTAFYVIIVCTYNFFF